jgi:hypothetical protein
MDGVYREALLGELRSEEKEGKPDDFKIVNLTCLPLLLYWVTPNRQLCGYDETRKRFVEGAPGFPLGAKGSGKNGVTFEGVNDGCCFVLLAARSGAFAAATRKKKVDRLSFEYSCAEMVDPNDLGEILPKPTQQRLVPGDSPTVVVGCGMVAATGGTLAREQYWRLSSESYSLAPKEKRTISYTTSNGMESISSEQKTLAVSVGASVSGGWGPVSASISSNLSSTSSSFQQVTLTTETTSFESHTIDNGPEDTLLALIWQLCDLIVVFDSQGALNATVSSLLNPSIVKTYPLKTLPPSPERGSLSEAQGGRAPGLAAT